MAVLCHTLNRLSCSTFLMATVSPVSAIVASNTMPKEPLPMILSAEKFNVTPWEVEEGIAVSGLVVLAWRTGRVVRESFFVHLQSWK